MLGGFLKRTNLPAEMRIYILLLLACPILLPAQSYLQNQHAGSQTASYDPALKPFYHGVASGDPLSDRVIIWTRVTPDSAFSGNKIDVSWYVASDTAMSNIVEQGFVTTDSSRDYTVKVDVGNLSPGSTYYYMFSSGGMNSLRGKTKTLPTGSISRLKFAVVSCNNYEAGYYNGFGRIADRQDLDAVLHLGDYIYEYQAGVYGDSSTNRFHQQFETVSKSQYRARYSLYRLDPDLRRAHQQHPFICIWDDHESANDAWKDGAENHDSSSQGAWNTRKSNANKVYFEWLPIRDNAQNSIYRQFNYGNLVDLIMLDTRLEGREEQINDVTDPLLYDPNRTILGSNQLNWFTNALSQSSAKWRVVGNQVIFAQLQLGWAGASTGQTPQQVESLFLDIWDGYPAERQKIISHLDQNNIDNTVFITGDFHSTFAFDIADTVVDESNFWAPVNNYDPSNGSGSKAVEFATPSISSANFDENVGVLLAAGFQAQINTPLPPPLPANNPNPHLKYVDLVQHGYFILDITPDSTKANYYFTPILQLSSNESFGKALKTADGQNHLESATESDDKAQLDIPAPLSILNRSIRIKEAGKFEVMSLYPNPAQDVLHLQLGALQAQNVNLKIIDLSGRVVKELDQTSLNTGIYEILVNIADLQPGQYLIILENQEGSRTFPFSVR